MSYMEQESARPFVETADSRETSHEIMDAIRYVAVNITSATEPYTPHGKPTGSNWHITRYALNYEERI